MQSVAFLFLVTVALASGVALKPAAKKIISATNDLVTVPNVRKSIVLLACENDDFNRIVKSLDPITPACYKCLFDKVRELSILLNEKQITENEVPQLLAAACGKYYSQLVQLQNATCEAVAPFAATARLAYGNLTENVKNTLNLIRKLSEDLKANPELEKNTQVYAARIHEITESVRNFNDEDRESIVAISPCSAPYILTSGEKHEQFEEYLNLVDARSTGNITEEEKEKLTEASIRYHLEARDNFVPTIQNLTASLQAATPDPVCLKDQVVVRVATKIANAVVDDYEQRINSNYFKKELNQAIKKSNKLKKAYNVEN